MTPVLRSIEVIQMTFHSELKAAIGVLAPIELSEFRDYLFPEATENLPHQIAGATPVNLLCKELLRRGRHLVVFSLHPSIEQERVFEGERLRIYLGPIKTVGALNGFREERRFLTNAIGREQLALLHAHWTYEYALAAIDAGIPYIVTAHDAPLTYFWWNISVNPWGAYSTKKYNSAIKNAALNLKIAARNNAFWVLRTRIAYKACRRARRLVAVSPYVADHLQRYRFHKKPIDVIPNGMPRHYFDRQLGRAPDTPFAFATALGGWGRLKNGALAIEAFAKVKKTLGEVKMLMFGSGYSADGPAAAWAREKGWDNGIEFRGHVPNAELIDLLPRRVDVLVHPSLVEAHPMPLIEAMSLGIPVIGGRAAGGVPWTLGDGAYGMLVDVRSPHAVAIAMLRLAQSKEVRTQLATVARESVKCRFHLDHVADRYESIYAQLVSGSSS